MDLAQDPHGVDEATRPRGSARWAGTDPSGAYVARRAKWTKWVESMGIMGAEYCVEREWGHHRQIKWHKVPNESSLIK